MSKAAKNEQRKLRATYFNNVAVGLTVAGYFIPFLSLASATNGTSPFGRLKDMFTWEGIVTKSPDDVHFLASLSGSLLALALAVTFRWVANSILSGIED